MRILSSYTLAVLVGALILSGCASVPYAEISGDKGPARADQLEENVRIVALDGRAILEGSIHERIEPGKRMLTLASARRDPRRAAVGKLIPLEARPCMRYHFFARHESMTMVDPWQLVLKEAEPISECMNRFPSVRPQTPSSAFIHP
jgi:hypothetical protein